MKIVVIIFTIFLMKNSFSAKRTNSKQVFELSNIKYSKKQKMKARLVFQLDKELRNGKVNRATTQLLLKLTRKGKLFKDLLPSLKKLNKISSPKTSISTIVNTCSKEDSQKLKDPISKRLSDKTTSFCFKRFLEEVSKNIKKVSSLKTKQVNYLRKAILHYDNANDFKLSKLILKKSQKYTKSHSRFSDIVSGIIIQYRIKPTKELLSLLKINNALSFYIQKEGLKSKDDQKYFSRAYKEIETEFNKKVQEGDYKEAATKLDYLISFYQENSRYLNQNKVWKSFISIGRRLLYQKRSELAKKSFSYAHHISSKGQEKDTSFYLLWSDLLFNKTKDAAKTIEKFKFVENFQNLGEKSQFWIAHTFYKNNEQSIANHLFNLITKDSPFSYYSILSLKYIHLIGEKKSPEKLVKQYKANKNIFKISEKDLSQNSKDSLKRLALWLDLKYSSFIRLEIDSLMTSKKEVLLLNNEKYADYTDNEIKRFLSVNLIKSFNRNGHYLQTFRLLHKSFSKNLFSVGSRSLKFLFPFEYVNLIKKIDQTIDPLVILSLIRQESAFNPEARSHVGARGLMQLMPATARDFNRRVLASELKAPETNIKIGIQYFKQLIEMYDGNLIYSLASYNAGQNRVKRWVKNRFFNQDPLYIIESIPYEETRNYVKYIYRNLFFYNLLQDNNRISMPIEDSFYLSKK